MTERPVLDSRRAAAPRAVVLDVREDIRTGLHPFAKIMAAAASASPDEALVLIAPFEPVPLYGVLEKQGFRHSSRPLDGGDWEVRFVRQNSQDASSPNPAVAVAAPPAPAGSAAKSAEAVEVDARGLEPPQPLVKILESVAALPIGSQLRARTDRRPIHLYAQLEERGFTAETQEEPDGSFLTYVRPR